VSFCGPELLKELVIFPDFLAAFQRPLCGGKTEKRRARGG